MKNHITRPQAAKIAARERRDGKSAIIDFLDIKGHAINDAAAITKDSCTHISFAACSEKGKAHLLQLFQEYGIEVDESAMPNMTEKSDFAISKVHSSYYPYFLKSKVPYNPFCFYCLPLSSETT